MICLAWSLSPGELYFPETLGSIASCTHLTRRQGAGRTESPVPASQSENLIVCQINWDFDVWDFVSRLVPQLVMQASVLFMYCHVRIVFIHVRKQKYFPATIVSIMLYNNIYGNIRLRKMTYILSQHHCQHPYR